MLLSEVNIAAGATVGTLIGALVANAVLSGDSSKHETESGKYMLYCVLLYYNTCSPKLCLFLVKAYMASSSSCPSSYPPI